MAVRHTQTDKLALALSALTRDGIAAIWQLNKPPRRHTEPATRSLPRPLWGSPTPRKQRGSGPKACGSSQSPPRRSESGCRGMAGLSARPV